MQNTITEEEKGKWAHSSNYNRLPHKHNSNWRIFILSNRWKQKKEIHKNLLSVNTISSGVYGGPSVNSVDDLVPKENKVVKWNYDYDTFEKANWRHTEQLCQKWYEPKYGQQFFEF